MKFEQKKIYLADTSGFVLADCAVLDESDRAILKEIYNEWRALSEKLKKIGSRYLNIPDGLSESAVCLTLGFVKVLKTKQTKGSQSFDVYDLDRRKRVQIKACSVIPDLTSFGPRTQWDDIYFVDFFRQGKWDGSFDIYLIPNELISNQNVNKGKGQTVRDKQKAQQRPRFSIYDSIIRKFGIPPTCTGRL